MRSTDDHSLMTLGERYSGAIDSSNLLMRDTRGDVDLICAAGLAADRMCGALLRLMVEYSKVRAEHVAADIRMRNREREAREQKNDAGDPTGYGWMSAEQKALQIRQEAETVALTAHVLILTHLRTLREAKERLALFAIAEATKRRFYRPDEVVVVIAGRVLDVFIAPTCTKCLGTGIIGSARRGEVERECRPCKGSGSRRESIGQSDSERLFARDLFAAIDLAMGRSQRQLGINLGAVRKAKEKIGDAVRGAMLKL